MWFGVSWGRSNAGHVCHVLLQVGSWSRGTLGAAAAGTGVRWGHWCCVSFHYTVEHHPRSYFCLFSKSQGKVTCQGHMVGWCRTSLSSSNTFLIPSFPVKQTNGNCCYKIDVGVMPAL